MMRLLTLFIHSELCRILEMKFAEFRTDNDTYFNTLVDLFVIVYKKTVYYKLIAFLMLLNQPVRHLKTVMCQKENVVKITHLCE